MSFADMPIDRFIRAMLDVPPNPRTGFIEKMDAANLRWFIAGEDQVIGPGHVPLIVRRGLTPFPIVSEAEIQLELDRMERDGLVVKFGRWYAWKERATPRARLKAAIYAPLVRRALKKAIREGEDLLARADVPDKLAEDIEPNGRGK